MRDRDAAKPVLWSLRKAFPAVRLAWADGIRAGQLVAWARTALTLTLAIGRRPGDLHTSQVLPAAGSSGAPWPGSPGTAAPSATTSA